LASHILKSAWDSLHQQSKKVVTLLFGVRSGWMTTRWKDNFKHFAMSDGSVHTQFWN
jgi:hypothetical protein